MERNHICKQCGGIAGWDSYFQSWICTRCGNMEPKPITNYDQIVSKSPEELAKWIAGGILNLTGGPLEMATEAWLDWLRKEGVMNGCHNCKNVNHLNLPDWSTMPCAACTGYGVDNDPTMWEAKLSTNMGK